MSIGKQVYFFIAPKDDWESQNPTLEDNYIGIERETLQLKMGDGLLPWLQLDYRVFELGEAEPKEKKKEEKVIEKDEPKEEKIEKPTKAKPKTR